MACFIDEDKECPTVGELEHSTTGKQVTWDIRNVSSLPPSVDFGVDSPAFTFADATWCLQLYPHGQRLRQSENSMDLQVVRRESLVEVHEGTVVFCLTPIISLDFNASFSDDEASTENDDFFIEPNRCVCSKTFKKYACAVPDEDFVAPRDFLVVGCTLLIQEHDDEHIKRADGSTTEDKEWFSIGDIEENPTVGTILVRDLKLINWRVPSFSSVLRHAGVQSPRFSASGATWCLRIRYCKEDETAKVAIVRLHTAKRCSQELCTCWEVDACFRKKIKTLKQGKCRAVVKRNHSENALFAFHCSQNFIKSCISAVTVSCHMKLRESAVDDGETELAGSIETFKLLGDFKRLLLTSEGSDVTLLVKGQTFAAHRAILRARSPVFSSMLSCDMKEKRTGSVDIEDCDPGTFPDFLHFLYCGSVENLSCENVFSLYRAADKYDVQDLKSQCVAFIQDSLTEDTFCDTLALSLQHGDRPLLKMATEFFAKNFRRIIVSVQWQEFIVENPTQCNDLFIRALVPDSASNN